MAKQLAVKGLPDELFEWLQEEKERRSVSLREVTEQILTEAKTNTGPKRPEWSFQPSFRFREEGSLPFRFIDLFAGIGGFRIGMERLGGDCVFTSEWDRFSQRTYTEWFGEKPHGDINEVNIEEDIPDHDVLCAGFPCQPFSLAGVSKKNSLGRKHGFKCKTQGTLFFRICEIISVKKPPVIMLENVKNLRSHNKGDTWRVIKESLDELGYDVHAEIIDGSQWVPQHRERIFIVGFRRSVFGDQVDFSFPKPPKGPKPKFRDILERAPDQKYTLTDKLWEYLQAYAEKHRSKGNGFGFGMTDRNGIARTLSARYYKDGSEILIPQRGKKNPRRLTPREAARLMGFPDELPIVVSDTQAYRQFGNAVIPLVVEAVGKQIVNQMRELVDGNGRCLIKGVYDEVAVQRG